MSVRRLGPEEIAKLMEVADIGVVVCDSVAGRFYAQAAVLEWCEEHECMWLYDKMEALNMLIRCGRKHGTKCPAKCKCTAWNDTEGTDCLDKDIGYKPLHKRAHTRTRRAQAARVRDACISRSQLVTEALIAAPP